jgi:hypothetical protein
MGPAQQVAIMDDPTTTGIDQIVDQVLVLDGGAAIEDALIQRLKYDLATKTHTYETIAKRYGLGGTQELLRYLSDHPGIVEDAKKIRAMFQSDQNVEGRVRTLFLHAAENLIPTMHNLVMDARTPVSARVDGFKQIQRGAGVDGTPRLAPGQQGTGGTPFVLNINFKNGTQTRIAGTTVLDAGEIPAPSQHPEEYSEEEFDEDV